MSGSASSHAPADGTSVRTLLLQARDGNATKIGRLLQLYRNYLTILATAQLDARLRRRMSPSDLVQEAMLGAFRDFSQFCGSTERELLAWLRRILIHCLHHAYERHIRAGRRDLRREVSLDALDRSLDRSAARMRQDIVDEQSSPSAPTHERERAVEMADKLAVLRPDYRDVIVLRNLQGLSFEEIAERLHRKPGAVRMLWLRAIEKLRHAYEEAE